MGRELANRKVDMEVKSNDIHMHPATPFMQMTGNDKI